MTTDLVYLTSDGVEFLTNVYQPAGDGPWPVVVSLHGLSPDHKDDRDTVGVARQAAAAGMVVFTPTWLVENPIRFKLDNYAAWLDRVTCAVAFAQQHASEYNGDATTIIVEGFSAGAAGGLILASAEPSAGAVPGCETPASPTPVKGFVLGDGDYLLASAIWDPLFATNPDLMRAKLASALGPSSWTTHPDASFSLWVASDGTPPRPIGDLSDASGWFAQRDPDGSLQADLERLDEFADGAVTSVDAGKLLALRLSEAGLEVTLDEYPGGHTTLNKVPEIVGYLHEAATR